MTNDFGRNWPGGQEDASQGGQGHDSAGAWNGYPGQQHGGYGYGEGGAPSGNEAAGWESANNPYYGQGQYGVQGQPKKAGAGLKILAVTLPILALAGGVVIGYVLFGDGVDAETVEVLESERDGLQQDLTDSQAQLQSRDADITSLEEQLEEAQTRSGGLDARATELDGRESDLDSREADLDQREADLDDREAGMNGGDSEPGATITEGVWTVGLDIEPGTYRVTEEIDSEQFCYWAIFESGTNQQDIITNSIPTGGYPQVTLEEGQDFESSDCGIWEQM